jgi:uncharacterized protein (TIGR03067 family)
MTPVLLFLAATVAAPAAKDVKKDADPLVGEWVAESWIKGGRPEEVRAGMGITFAPGGKARLAEGGKDLETTYTTDAGKDPPHLDIVVPGGGMGPTLTGIYKRDGDTLTLALGPDGERPARFESAAGSRVMLMVLKRKKKE